MVSNALSRRSFLLGTATCAAIAATTSTFGRGSLPLAFADSATYTAGTYTGFGTGISSIVVVSITFDETSMTEVMVDSSGETKTIGAAAANTLAAQVLTAQSADIDGVSGATITSIAVREAAAACIAQATGETSFPDVDDSSKWYYDATLALAASGYITGYSTGLYGVGEPMTRAQLVTVLWRIAEPTSYENYDQASAVNTSGLSDVKDGKYYTEAVNWAVEESIITGYSTGEFGVSDPITFQQFCLVLARYLNDGDDNLEALMTDDEADAILAGFADGSSVSGYANKGMAYLTQVAYNDDGDTLVGGTAEGLLKPTGSVNRERVAVVLYRALVAGLL